ncbi:MAG: hypothetical protein AB1634_16885, partial [Thermodesulfobacteriota bacterium]
LFHSPQFCLWLATAGCLSADPRLWRWLALYGLATYLSFPVLFDLQALPAAPVSVQYAYQGSVVLLAGLRLGLLGWLILTRAEAGSQAREVA